MMALSIGGILGNLWTEFTWAPQLGVLQALLVIALLPLKYWLGVNGAPDVGTVYGMRKSERIGEGLLCFHDFLR